MKRVLIFFLLILSTTTVADNPYNNIFFLKDNAASRFYEDELSLSTQYIHDINTIDANLGFPIFGINSYFGGVKNFENDSFDFYTIFSLSFGENIGIAYQYSTEEQFKNHQLSIFTRGSWGYFGFSKNGFSDWSGSSFQIGVSPIKYISIFSKIDYNMDKNWDFSAGLELKLSGLVLSYSGIYKNEELSHLFTVGFSFPYSDFMVKSSTESLQSIQLKLHSKKERESFFSEDNIYLNISLNEPISEIGSGGFIDGSRYSFLDLIVLLEKGVKDKSVKGFIFEIDGSPLSISQVEEIISFFKKNKSDKKVLLYLRNTKLSSYLLSSISDKVYIHPASELSIQGPYFVLFFYKKLLNFVGIDTYFFKRSEYKTAPESYTDDTPSKYYMEEMDNIKKILSAWIKEKISDGRKLIGVDYLLSDAPYPASRACQLGFTDEMLYFDQLIDNLKKEGVTVLKPKNYLSHYKKPIHYNYTDKVAVISIEGVITEEISGNFLNGTVNYRKQIIDVIKSVKDDASIDAVILRINSPGGSGFVSDEFHFQLKELSKRKPLYVSMSSVAASGGYYIAVAGGPIFANQMTITGSIGVYSGQIVVEKFLKKIAIQIFDSSMWENGSLNSMFRQPTTAQIAKMEELVESFYNIFLDRVKTGRKLTDDEVEKSAKGQVFMGEKAKELRLIDQIGSFYDCSQALKKEINSDEIEFIAYPQQNNFLLTLFGDEKNLYFQFKNYINTIQSQNLLLFDLELTE